MFYLVYALYYIVYLILLALGGLWCFDECCLAEREEDDLIDYRINFNNNEY